jgi:predicted nucleotidyltransferase
MELELEDWVTAHDAARRLGVSRERIHQLARARALDVSHLAGRLLVHRRSLEMLALVRRRPGRPRKRPLPTLDKLRSKREQILTLAATHGAHNVRIFGSVARREAYPGSDIDIAVDLDRDRTFGDLAVLGDELQQLLGTDADLVNAKQLSANARARLLEDSVPL